MKAIFASILLPALLAAAELKDVKAVYLYPMVGGLDQHLANALTKDHIFRVVADPKLADAIFTDQLGQQFEYRVEHIKRDSMKAAAPVAPAPPPPPAASAGQQVPAGVVTTAATTAESEPHSSTFTKGKGTIFLVDAKSREVVWSDYRRPKNTSPQELEKTAKHLAMNITKTLTPTPAGAK